MVAHGAVAEIAKKRAGHREVRLQSNGGEAYRASEHPDRRAARIRFLGEPARVSAALSRVSLLFDVSVSKLGHATFSYAGDERTLGEAVRALVLADVLVCGVEPERHDLERVFLELTRGEVS
jgi:ABC-2 type transport system ATP-binding protein